ncbi:unnamed protein product [Spirodela intermedia]|uniref:LysM domain-containing protein n=2 Tax=Spirodela intermedia TaxID=51605 RepID=A0A7I8JTY0_SPIIN|nr:unnamed protein product [Spirodela intermedia]CAA6673549.1 unnamed protein product [Spirodela intermedia]CAA7410785.1 unnamed protein product [Spirodela intermedia]
MARSGGPVILPLPLLSLFLLVSACVAQPPPKFRCTSKSKCQALVGYVPPRETTYEAIRGLFEVGSIYDLYGANGLNETTPTSTKVPANTTVRIPFTCTCRNGTGVSDRRPVFAVRNGDSLQAIAQEIFGGLVTYQQIAAANSIGNTSLINAGQRLYIPLPCNCDEDSYNTIHLAHIVKAGSTLAEVSSEFWASQASLISLNNISDPKNLLAGQVLDVPLSACGLFSVRPNSPDFGLLVPNGSYVLTAGNCIKCICNRPAAEMICFDSPASVDDVSRGCNRQRCYSEDYPGGELEFGTLYVSSCTATQCLYAGYDDREILTDTMTRRRTKCGKLHNSGPVTAVALVSLLLEHGCPSRRRVNLILPPLSGLGFGKIYTIRLDGRERDP